MAKGSKKGTKDTKKKDTKKKDTKGAKKSKKKDAKKTGKTQKKDNKGQSVRKLRVEKEKNKAKGKGKKGAGKKGGSAKKETRKKGSSGKKGGGKKKQEVEIYDATVVKLIKKMTESRQASINEKETPLGILMSEVYSIDEDEFNGAEYEKRSVLGIDPKAIDGSFVYETDAALMEKKDDKASTKAKSKAKPKLEALAKKVKALRDKVIEEEVTRKQKTGDDWAKFKILSENLVDVVWTTDLDMNFTFYSPSVKHQLGYTTKEAMTLKPEDILAGDSFELFADTLSEAFETEASGGNIKDDSWTLELEHLRKDGGTVWTECRMTFLRGGAGQATGILGVTRDISRRREAETALVNTMIRYKSLYESNQDGIIYTAMDGNIIDANRAYLDMLGYTLEELRGLRYQDLTPKKWRDVEKDIIKNQIAKRGFSEEYEKEYIHKDGTVIPIAIRVWLIIDAYGEPAGFWAIVRDINKRREVVEQLKRSERRLTLIAENTSDLITICDLDGTITYGSPSYSKLYYSDVDLLGETYFDFLKPDDQEELMNFVEGALLDDQERFGTYFEYYIKDKVGTWHLLEATMNITKEKGGMRGTIVVISRLSTKKRRSTRRGGRRSGGAKGGGKGKGGAKSKGGKGGGKGGGAKGGGKGKGGKGGAKGGAKSKGGGKGKGGKGGGGGRGKKKK